MSHSPQVRTIILLGAGHTHLHVLDKWRTSRIPDTRLICISDFPVAAYSGMLTGTLAGLYQRGEMEIDLSSLCQRSGAKFVQRQVQNIDSSRRTLYLTDGTSLGFDVLSIGIGSVPDSGLVKEWGPEILSLKPMQTLLGRLVNWSDSFRRTNVGRPPRIAIVGAGAAGVEIAFCLPFWLRKNRFESPEITLVDSNSEVANEMPRPVRRIIQQELARRGARMILGKPVQSIASGTITLHGSESHEFDMIVLATSAVGSPDLRHFSLPLSDRGFLRTKHTLQVEDDLPIFAVGDCGSIVDHRVPKAGVFAVRQGPVLWANIKNMLARRKLQGFRPQQGFLKLLCTGDGKAILSYAGLGVHAQWCWNLKDRIDRKFVETYQCTLSEK